MGKSKLDNRRGARACGAGRPLLCGGKERGELGMRFDEKLRGESGEVETGPTAHGRDQK